MNGVLVIDKPMGFTSFDVIAVVRKLTGQRKTGHTGTLDPNATGVLPVLLGNATKAQDLLPDHTKAYTAGFRFGLKTDTLDVWGKTLATAPSAFSREQIDAALAPFRGDILQTPPLYSAVKKDGKRLYDLARQGVEVERAARPVRIDQLKLLSFDSEAQTGTLKIICSRGTYVRSLIDDLASSLGSCAVMTSLRRTAACGFTPEDCLTLEQLRGMAENGTIAASLRPTDSLFAVYPSLTLSPAQAKRFANGGAIDIARTPLRDSGMPDGTIVRMYGGAEFLGLSAVRECQLRIYKLFPTF